MISEAFSTFLSEAPDMAKAWGDAIQNLSAASKLDERTRSLCYLSVLAALGRSSGVPFHVKALKRDGVSRGEVISAILVGLPAAGHVVTQSLPAALKAYDE